MSTKPIETTFGLHLQRLGTLPNFDQWQQIKSYIQSYSPIKLLAANIEAELRFLTQNSDCNLVVKVPTLGFTDPAFDYDLRPWFLTPVMVNGYIAPTGGLENTKVAELWATDLADNHFKLWFTPKGLLDYDKISEQAASEVVFTTLKSIQYVFSLATLLGEGLEKLVNGPVLSHQQSSLCFFPPPILRQEYEVEIFVINAEKNIVQKRTINIKAESQSYLFVSHFETVLSRSVQMHSKGKDFLSIKAGAYVEKELLFSRYGYKIKIRPNSQVKLGQLSAYTQLMPYHFRPGIDYLKKNKAIYKQNNLYEYVLFFGLSHEASRQLVRVIISKEKFFKNHLISSAQKKKKSKSQYNDYYLYPDLLDELYDLVTDACAHKTIPLYALSESFELSAIIFAKLMNLDASKWDAHDKWVFERMIYEQLPSICKNYDPMEVGFEWVDKIDKLLSEHATDIDIQNNIEIISGKLSSQQLIEVEVYLEDFEKSAFAKYEENIPSLTLSKTLESAEFNEKYGKSTMHNWFNNIC